LLALHASPEPQRLFAQHASPLPPHAVQALFPVQTLSSAQRCPTSMHVFAAGDVVSQQPALQVSPAQQGCPFPPQPAHWPEARQKSPL
jgi:hypothetical protein